VCVYIHTCVYIYICVYIYANTPLYPNVSVGLKYICEMRRIHAMYLLCIFVWCDALICVPWCIHVYLCDVTHSRDVFVEFICAMRCIHGVVWSINLCDLAHTYICVCDAFIFVSCEAFSYVFDVMYSFVWWDTFICLCEVMHSSLCDWCIHM